MSNIIGRMLDFSGRTGVVDYWRLQRPLILIQTAGIVVCLGFLMSPAPHLLAIVGLPLILLALVANVALIVRRLHDRGRSGWWMLLFQGAPLSMSLSAGMADPGIFGGSPAAVWGPALLSVGSLAFAIWGFVEIGLRRGQTGDNRFGPAPA